MEEVKCKLAPVHGMRPYGGVEVQLHLFLTSELGAGEWSDSRPAAFPLRKGIRAGLDTPGNFSSSCRESSVARRKAQSTHTHKLKKVGSDNTKWTVIVKDSV